MRCRLSFEFLVPQQGESDSLRYKIYKSVHENQLILNESQHRKLEGNRKQKVILWFAQFSIPCIFTHLLIMRFIKYTKFGQ